MDESNYPNEGMDTPWREKYKSLREYYANQYDPRYFSFNQYEIEIDPDETLDQVEAYSPARQQQELQKCYQSFSYFCQKYVKIGHPIRGLVPFLLFKYQKRSIKEFGTHRFNIISKFRQGGLTTVTVLWGLWRMMFKMNETFMLLSKSDREAIVAGEIAKRGLDHMPSWLKPTMEVDNAHEKVNKDTESKMLFYTPEAARGRSITYLILDEAAFIRDMDRHWKSMYPTLATGGHCIAISTVNGMGNWYEETYHAAENNENPFHIINLDFQEHPDYNKPDWEAETRAVLTERGFRQEILRDFMGSGVTYIPEKSVKEISERTKSILPKRKLFPEYNNISKAFKNKKNDFSELAEKGALWIFVEPVAGREYIIGVDGAEGVGEEGDNSCFQVIDTGTNEQVAEFYSNVVPTDTFAKILSQIGIYYNNALMVIENMGGAGLAIINKLQNELYYENLHYENVRSMEKPGIKVGRNNRTLILESLQNRICNKSLIINSKRLANEMTTFFYNQQAKRAEAQKGKHDDAIMAMAHALHVRDQVIRAVPVGGEIPIEITEMFKSDVYEQIKAELRRGAPEDWMGDYGRENAKADPDASDETFGGFLAKHRKNDSLLKEFGW